MIDALASAFSLFVLAGVVVSAFFAGRLILNRPRRGTGAHDD